MKCEDWLLAKVASMLAIGPSDIKIDSHLDYDLYFDSLDKEELNAAVENEFDVSITEQMETLQDIVNFVEAKRVER